MNGKTLSNLELLERITSLNGIACSPEGDLYVSSSDPFTIVKQEAGESDWVTLYYCQQDDYEGEDVNKFDRSCTISSRSDVLWELVSESSPSLLESLFWMMAYGYTSLRATTSAASGHVFTAI